MSVMVHLYVGVCFYIFQIFSLYLIITTKLGDCTRDIQLLLTHIMSRVQPKIQVQFICTSFHYHTPPLYCSVLMPTSVKTQLAFSVSYTLQTCQWNSEFMDGQRSFLYVKSINSEFNISTRIRSENIIRCMDIKNFLLWTQMRDDDTFLNMNTI